MARDYVVLARGLAEPLAASLGLCLWGIEFVGGGRPVLRIFVERAGGEKAAEASGGQVEDASRSVSVDECAELSRLLGLSMDVDDTFDVPWVLEVSSPGLERVFFALEQLRGYVGREVEALLDCPHPDWPSSEGAPGRRKFVGTLKAVGEDAFSLSVPESQRLVTDPAEVVIPWGLVRRAHLIHVFTEPGLPGKGARKASKRGGIV